jgi:hypothetical protein
MAQKPTVSDKNTKAQILAEYERTLAQLNESKSQTLNPVQEKKAKRRDKVVAETKEITTDAVEKSLQAVRNRAASLLSDLEDTLKNEVEQLRTVEEAIQFRQEEVAEVFGIEKEASSLAALVEAQAQKKADFQREMTEAQESFRKEQERARQAWQEEKAEHKRQFDLQTQLDQERRDRELADYKYNFGREERQKLDALEDQLRQQRRTYQAEVETTNKSLQEREEAVGKREAEFVANEAKLVELQGLLETKVADAIEDTKKNMNASNAIAQNAIKREYEAKVTVLEGKLETTEDQLHGARTRVDKLENDLSAARAEVQAVALRALDASSTKEALAAVQNTVAAGSTVKR